MTHIFCVEVTECDLTNVHIWKIWCSQESFWQIKKVFSVAVPNSMMFSKGTCIYTSSNIPLGGGLVPLVSVGLNLAGGSGRLRLISAWCFWYIISPTRICKVLEYSFLSCVGPQVLQILTALTYPFLADFVRRIDLSFFRNNFLFNIRNTGTRIYVTSTMVVTSLCKYQSINIPYLFK